MSPPARVYESAAALVLQPAGRAPSRTPPRPSSTRPRSLGPPDVRAAAGARLAPPSHGFSAPAGRGGSDTRAAAARISAAATAADYRRRPPGDRRRREAGDRDTLAAAMRRCAASRLLSVLCSLPDAAAGAGGRGAGARPLRARAARSSRSTNTARRSPSSRRRTSRSRTRPSSTTSPSATGGSARSPEALQFYRRFLATAAPDDKTRPVVEQRIADLKTVGEEPKVGATGDAPPGPAATTLALTAPPPAGEPAATLVGTPAPRRAAEPRPFYTRPWFLVTVGVVVVASAVGIWALSRAPEPPGTRARQPERLLRMRRRASRHRLVPAGDGRSRPRATSRIRSSSCKVDADPDVADVMQLRAQVSNAGDGSDAPVPGHARRRSRSRSRRRSR